MANQVIKKCYVDVANDSSFVQISVVLGDSESRIAQISVMQGNEPYNIRDVSVYIAGKKPDGTVIENACEIVSDNVVNVNITGQMCAAPGITEYNLNFVNVRQNFQLKSFPFYLYVLNSGASIIDIESMSEFQVLDTMIRTAEGYKDASATFANNALTSEQLSKSWAVGQTGQRPDEATNNSQYYAQQSNIFQQYSSRDSMLSKSWAVGDTGIGVYTDIYGVVHDRTNENTDNSKYYADNSHSYMNNAWSYMDTAGQYMNTTNSYMNTTNGYMNTTEGYKNTAKQYMDTTIATKDEVDRIVRADKIKINFETGFMYYTV